MPRKARIDYPGGVHHLIIRGIERKRIFQDDLDRHHFLDRLGNILVESETPCYAWSFMQNHVHLLVRTGNVPIPTIMRRLLTGYAVTYNRKYRRHGPLFQNRYKSILCQEDRYLLELVRYIHLNPLRAKLVPNLTVLDTYPYSGHSTLMGYRKNAWQDTDYVLGYFGPKRGSARRQYRAYVKEGVQEGRRPDLVGGGLIRSIGGWIELKALRKIGERIKGDERILGDSTFVEKVLRASEEKIGRQYRLIAEGFDLKKLAKRVGEVLGVAAERVWSFGKCSEVVEARSLLCYWAVKELGVSATEVARGLRVSQPAVSISVRRGERIAMEKGFKLLGE